MLATIDGSVKSVLMSSGTSESGKLIVVPAEGGISPERLRAIFILGIPVKETEFELLRSLHNRYEHVIRQHNNQLLP